MRRVLALLLFGVLPGLLSALPAAAAGGLCTDESGQPITNCTVEDPGFLSSTEPGIPSGFLALMVGVALVGLVVTIYKVFMARDMARKSGMDPDQATAMTLLEDDGLEATYLASNLRPQTQATPATPAQRTVSERLAELDSLLQAGRVTQAEYDEQRAAILASL